MHTSTVLSSILPLLSLGLALPLESRDLPEFTLTSLGATFPESGPYGSTTLASDIEVSITYPDVSSPGNTITTTCGANWPAGTAPGPTDWADCANGELQFRLAEKGWTGVTNFRVEFWQQLTSDGAGLDATSYITSNPGNPSDPNAYMFCVQRGKFNPLSCSLTGPYGQTPRTVTMYASSESSRPE